MKFETAESVLKYIVQKNGIDFLYDGKKVMAYFADLAPNLQKEYVLFSKFIECNGHVALLDARKANESKPQLEIQNIINRMVNNYYLSETFSSEVCDQFWNGISGSNCKNTTFILDKDSPKESVSMIAAHTTNNCFQDCMAHREMNPAHNETKNSYIKRILAKPLQMFSNFEKRLYFMLLSYGIITPAKKPMNRAAKIIFWVYGLVMIIDFVIVAITSLLYPS